MVTHLSYFELYNAKSCFCFCSSDVADSEGAVGDQPKVLYSFADSLSTHFNGATQAVGVQGVDLLPGPTLAAER